MQASSWGRNIRGIVSRAQCSTQCCVADPGPSFALEETGVPDQRCTTSCCTASGTSKELSMIPSRDRILTTHVGSLPRNEKLSDLLMAQEEGKPFEPGVLAGEMDAAVRHVV